MKTFLASLFLLALACIGTGYVISAPKEDHETLSPVPCKLHNHDVKKIAQAVYAGLPKDFIIQVAQKSAGIEIARMEAIKKLADDAYANAARIQAWYDNHIWVCTDA